MLTNTLRKSKCALVTGGAGFIGSHLAKAAIGKFYTVDIVDTAMPTFDPHSRQFVVNNCRMPCVYIINPDDSINMLTTDLHFTKVVTAVGFESINNSKYINGDFASEPVLEKIRNGCYDVIFHLAADASVPKCQENIVTSSDNNLLSTIKLFDAVSQCKTHKPAIIFSSSAAVYGVTKSKAVAEDKKTIPISAYGLQKLTCEKFLKLYCETKGVQGISLRYFNVYGPGQLADGPYAGVVAKWCQAASLGKEIEVNGDPARIFRDFVHVDQVVSTNLSFAYANSYFLNGQSINVGSGKPTSLASLIKLIEENSDSPLKLVTRDKRIADIDYSCADITNLKALMYKHFGVYNYHHVRLHEGIKNTALWWKHAKEK